MNWKARKSLILVAMALFALAPATTTLWAQSGTTGTLDGTIANAAGAPLPGARVTLTNDATAQPQSATSNDSGHYEFPSLTPGSYSMTVTAAGFKSARVTSVTVNGSEEAVVDAKLDAGQTEQPVACQCMISHSASSSTGTLVDSKAITSVPLTTRNFTQVLSTASGAASDVNNAGLLGAGNQSVNVNGNTAGSVFTIDGTTASAVPNPDTITQFRIQTSQYDSGYGSHVPNTNLITKAGGNDFHGTLWEFVRNDVFNANAFFLKRDGQPRPNLKQNQFGGAFGGPIKKNKLFFFGSYQGTRQVNGLDPTSLSTLTQPLLTNDRSAAAIGSEFCPGNKVAALQPVYNTFAGGTQVACNGSNINPAALKILQAKLPDGSFLIPTPQNTATFMSGGVPYNLGQSSYSLPSFFNEDHYLVNTDYLISKANTLAGRFFYSHVNQVRTFGGPNNPGPAFTPGGPQAFQNANYAISLKLTSVVRSNLVNEVRMAFSRKSSVGTGPGIPTATSLLMTPVDPLFNEPPEITVQGSLGTFRFFGNSLNDFTDRTDSYQWADNVSWIHGRHTLRTGVYVDTSLEERFDTGPARGKITFQNFTDFLLGQNAAQTGTVSSIDSITANEGTGPQGEPHYRNQFYNFASFLQDDFKLRPRLTMNLGIRWEYISPSFDPAGQMGNTSLALLSTVPIPPASGTYVGNTVAANYDPTTVNPYTNLPFGPAPAGVVVRSSKTLYDNDTPLDGFAPRFGFAWQPGGHQSRLAVRGGYGWFFQTPSQGGNTNNSSLFTQPPFAQGFTNTSTSNGASTLQAPFPTTTLGFQLRTPTSQLSDRIGGPVYKMPTLQQWNLAMQFTILPGLTLDMGYVGSFGTHLLIAQNLNQPALASVAHPVNCGYNGGNPANIANCITTSTAANAALRVPILGETPTALTNYAYTGLSRYNGLQATVRKQVARGIAFQFSYTYSKSMYNSFRFNDQTNAHLDWTRSNFDRTHRIIFNYSYDVPGLMQSRGFLGAATRGWSLSGVTSIQTGAPLTLTDRRAGTVYGRAGNGTITLCPGATYADLITPGGTKDRVNNWINTSVICAPTAVGDEIAGSRATTYGTAGQNIINGPGQFDWDVSFGKMTRVGGIREDAEMQFRVEFYNAFNHPQFSNPGVAFGTSNFGKITQTSVAPRLIQFGVKYLF